MQFLRTKYLEKLNKWKDEHFIKVITGVRYCGKTSILNQFIQQLKDEGTFNEQIQQYDFNILDADKYGWEKLKKLIIKNSIASKTNYIFLDEIQEVKNFEKCVIALFEDKTIKFDIYVTGSNSTMFSSSMATKFTGRHIEIKVFPLSFSEFYKCVKTIDSTKEKMEIFWNYVKYGGLPIILNFLDSEEKTKIALAKVLQDCIETDIYKRHNIKTENFLKISNYMFLQIAQPFSATNVQNFLKSNNSDDIDYKTIMRYIGWLMEANLLYECEFALTKTKDVLKTNAKYYSVDTGLRNSASRWTNINRGYQIENIVFLELLRNGYEVNVGRLWDNREIDFIASKNDETLYIQVTEKIDWDKETPNYKREIGNLESIRNSHPKIVLSVYDETTVLNSGVKVINLFEWLMK